MRNGYSGLSGQGTTISAPLVPAVNGWSIVPSPNINEGLQQNELYRVACNSGTDCWAVGQYYDSGRSRLQSLIQHWDGISWSLVASNTSTTEHNALRGVACASASDCWAVGYDTNNGDKTLIEHWNGFSWSVVSSPNPGNAQSSYLRDVTCRSTSDCWAAGYYFGPSNQQTLIEHWNGVSWSIVDSTNTSPSRNNALEAMTCSSSSDCWAIGSYDDDNPGFHTLIEHWNGTAWSIIPGAPADFLYAITCSSSSECWAVGEYNFQTFIEKWNGSVWTVISSPNANENSNALYGVTCVSAQNCWAVGVAPFYGNLVEHWDGNSWSIVPAQNSSDGTGPLNSIACSSSSDCWAVGVHYANASDDQTTAEHWDGSSWTLGSSGNINTAKQTNPLAAVTCTSATDCWAVGYHILPDSQTLIEHWDGTQWTISNSPNDNITGGGALTAVTCLGANNCWAVGSSVDYPSRTLIEHWDGNLWSIVSSPNSGGDSNALLGVSCASQSDCWATGYYHKSVGNYDQTLVEHWNGASWLVVTSPNSTTRDNHLNGAWCVPGSTCWAAGYYLTTTNISQTLIERWNGTSWEIVSSPNSGTQNNSLSAIACTSGSDCWVVGQYKNGSVQQTLIERWAGSSWTIISSPNAGTTKNNYLNGVACTSMLQCWAIGSYQPSAQQTLIEQWNGTSWSIVSSPNGSPSRDNVLTGVNCVSQSDCWASGRYSDGADQTLIEQFTIPPQLVAAVSRKMHGSAGTFDVDLPLSGNPGIECRSGGANASYQVVLTFMSNLTSVSSATVDSASISNSSIGPNQNQYTVNLTGVPNAHSTTVILNTVQDAAGNTGSAFGTMAVLIGDTTGNGTVSSADVSQVKLQSGQPLTNSNFRADVNVSGTITSTDVSTVKSRTGTSLP